LSHDTSRLDSGLTVVTEQVPHLHSASVGFWVGTGSRDEAPDLAGASHFLEHLLFKGTERLTARAIAEAIDAVGGEMNAFTTKEYTAFYVRVLGTDLDLALDVLTDIMWDPAFRAEEVEAERHVILEEILMRGDEPADLAQELLFEALYPGHPLGRDVLGDEDTIEAMSRDDVAAFFAHHYRPGNMVVAAAGAVEHERLVERLAAAPSRDGDPARAERSAPGNRPEARVVLERPTEQAHVALGVPGLDVEDPDRYALALVEQILGGGMSSRLFQEIREERGLAYSVYSFRAAFADTGMLGVYAGTAPDREGEVVDLIGRALDLMAADGPSTRELEVAKGQLRGSMLLGLEDSAGRMSRIGRSELVHGEVPSIDDVLSRVDAVTLDDARKVAARVLGADRSLAVVGPRSVSL
jgi:predicted Zn-dependent peptidase